VTDRTTETLLPLLLGIDLHGLGLFGGRGWKRTLPKSNITCGIPQTLDPVFYLNLI
jgi:hypothetical protein